jgi:UDP-N-acetylglucosamine 4-epimerase
VQANLLAATTPNTEAVNQVFNIAAGGRTTLNELYAQLKQNLISSCPHLKDVQAVYRDFRAGDVRHSLASIDKARDRLGYHPTQSMEQGLKLACALRTHSASSPSQA